MTKEYRFRNRVSLITGYSKHTVRLGFSIGKYGIDADFFFFWFSLEW